MKFVPFEFLVVACGLIFLVGQLGAAPAPDDSATASFATPSDVVDIALQLIAPTAGMTLVDLGCGDGRFSITAVSRFGMKSAVGYDSNATQVQLARKAAALANVVGRVSFVEDDFFTADVRTADVVIAYVVPKTISRVYKKLFAELKPGALILTQDYTFGHSVVPYVTLTTTNADKALRAGGTSDVSLYLFRVPSLTPDRMPRKAVLDVPYIKHPDPQAPLTLFVEAPLCSSDRRFGCFTALARVEHNVVRYLAVRLPKFRELENVTLTVTNAKTREVLQAHQFLETHTSVVKHNETHAAVFYVAETLEAFVPNGTSAVGGEKMLSLEVVLQRPPETLSEYYHVASRCAVPDLSLEDGEYNVEALPRGLLAYCIVRLEHNEVGAWFMRAGAQGTLFMEVIIDGAVRIARRLLPSAPGFRVVDSAAKRTENSTMMVRATFLEPHPHCRLEFDILGFKNRVVSKLTPRTPSVVFRKTDVRAMLKDRQLLSDEAEPHCPAIALQFTQEPGFDTWGLRVLHRAKGAPTRIPSKVVIVGQEPAGVLPVQHLNGVFTLECFPDLRLPTTPEELQKISHGEFNTICRYHSVFPISTAPEDLLVDVLLYFDQSSETSKTGLQRWLESTGAEFHKSIPLPFPLRVGRVTRDELLLVPRVAIPKGTRLFTMDQQTVIGPSCMLCAGRWYEDALFNVTASHPLVHRALLLAQLMLHSMDPAEAPIDNSLALEPLLTFLEQLREAFVTEPLPFQHVFEEIHKDLDTPSYEQTALREMAMEQRAALSDVFWALTRAAAEEPHDRQWFAQSFPTLGRWLEYVARTAAMTFPHGALVSAVHPLLKVSEMPNVETDYDEARTVFLTTTRDIAAGEPLSLGCSATKHEMTFFYHDAARTARFKGASACTPSALLETGYLLTEDSTSFHSHIRWIGDDRKRAHRVLTEAHRRMTDREQRSIVSYHLEMLQESSAETRF